MIPDLSPDEVVVWRGEPKSSLRWTRYEVMICAIFGVGFTLCGIFIFVLETTGQNESQLVWQVVAAIAFTGTGISVVTKYALRRVIVPRYTDYLLTDKRAVISSQVPMFGSRVSEYHLPLNTEVTIEGARLSSVFFAKIDDDSQDDPVWIRVGFEKIGSDDAEHVYEFLKNNLRN